ncbi:cytochrome c oxidase subunit 3 [uncultured Cyclobacterium sp.]|uniref:cytochrome c oxidase subunit 3 n=1 Tax=uncultured Cyclobacterium sp. TaxID=453820 RepID=UPI0030EDF441|tara:strand:+ start:26285 stop:26908 length:624 start_codon:yes stop_codon:yes gene_type:complete
MDLRKERKKTHWFKRMEQMHPYQTLIYLAMFSSGLIFLFLTLSFIFSQSETNSFAQYKIPKPFIISSLILFGSAFISEKILPAFLAHDLKKTKINLVYTLFLGLSFTAFQFKGWEELSNSGVDFTGLPAGSFLYLLSGIHLVHLTGAMIYALVLLLLIYNSEKDEVKTLVLLTNPYEKMKLELFIIYWKFMDIVWLILFGLFLWVLQ